MSHITAGIKAISSLTKDMKKSFADKLEKIIAEEMEGYEEAEGLNQTPKKVIK